MGGWVSPGRDGPEAMLWGLGFPGQGDASFYFFFFVGRKQNQRKAIEPQKPCRSASSS